MLRATRALQSGPSTNNSPDGDDGNLSATAIVFIVLAILALCFALLCYVYLTRCKKVEEEPPKEEIPPEEEEESEATESLEPVDLVSCASECKEEVEDENLEPEDLFADPADLGRHHSTLDVHQCSSANCMACRRENTTFVATLSPQMEEQGVEPAAVEQETEKDEEGVEVEEGKEAQLFETKANASEEEEDEVQENELSPMGDGMVKICITTSTSSESNTNYSTSSHDDDETSDGEIESISDEEASEGFVEEESKSFIDEETSRSLVHVGNVDL